MQINFPLTSPTPCTQALSKRIHYGKFVAEAKFQSQTEKYAALIQRQDVDGIMDALTDRVVELKVSESECSPLLCPAPP